MGRMNVTASETVLIPADIYGCDIIPWLVRLGTRAQQGHTRTACDSRTPYRHLREPEATLEPRATFVRTLLMPASGHFGRFSGPRGPKWSVHFWHLTQKERCTGEAECTQVTLFPYEYWVFEEKTRFGPVSGLPGPKRVSGNCRKWPKATGRNCVAGPFMHES